MGSREEALLPRLHALGSRRGSKGSTNRAPNGAEGALTISKNPMKTVGNRAARKREGGKQRKVVSDGAAKPQTNGIHTQTRHTEMSLHAIHSK